MSDNYARVAIVTGATSGIGEATARRFVAAGFGVTGNGRNAAKLVALEKELGSAFCGVAGDFGHTAVLDQLFVSARERFGRPADVVVANAGIGLGGSVKNADLSKVDDVIRTNVISTLALLQRAARKMEAQQQTGYPKSAADIVIVGSIAGRHVSAHSAVYAATKSAVHGLAEGLRREVGPSGVRVTLVEPGLVLSGFQAAAGYSDELVNGFKDKFGPLLIGDDVANAIHYIVTQAPHVHVSDIVIRPTRQDYP
jgi:NADP-dependent 3-hydroxy acid dehydrogenase YdfG